MKTFNDNAGRTWTLSINVDAIRRVRAMLDVDLLQAVHGKLIERLATDPILLCDIIYVICRPEAESRNISDEDFGRAMAGDAIEHATTSLLEELVEFFPLNKRRLLAKALEKYRNLESKAIEVVDRQLSDPDLETKLLAKLTPGDSSGNSPESSVSTPIR